MKECAICGETFVPYRPSGRPQVTCGPGCQRKRERMLANARRRAACRSRQRAVDPAPFREAFERSGMSKSDLCRAAGWVSSGKCNTSQVTRMMTGKYLQQRTAERLMPALGLDPVDVGL